MMEREFISQKIKELQIKNYLETKLSNVGLSEIRLKKIPLGEKIIIATSRPSLIVGSKGSNIKDLTKYLKQEFKLENPQIEINEIKDIFLDANVVAEKIASSLERFGSARFKGVGHKTMGNVIKAGALGVEIIISGKIPGARAKSWRFYQGYLKKCGDISIVGVRRAKKTANLKSGIIGIKVSIMPPDIELPDKIEILKDAEIIEEAKEVEEKQKVSSGNDKGKEEKQKKKEAVKEGKESEKEEKKTEEKKQDEEKTKELPSAEELIKATKEKFKDEKTQVRDPKKITAEELIEKAKLLNENEKGLEKPKVSQKKESK
jgi:small subunit ribosomal protein S3